MARVFRASSSPSSAGDLRHYPKEPVQIPHNCFREGFAPIFAEQYYVNAGTDDSPKRIIRGSHPPKVFGARRNPVRVTRLGLGAGVIFFCRAAAAMKINLSDTFRRHAQECQRMAASARNPVDKATWSQMAKRCLACAEYYENQQSALDGQAVARNRRAHRRWAQTRGSDLAHQQ